MSTRASVYFEFSKVQRPQENLLKNFYSCLNLSFPLGGAKDTVMEGRRRVIQTENTSSLYSHQEDSTQLTQLSCCVDETHFSSKHEDFHSLASLKPIHIFR